MDQFRHWIFGDKHEKYLPFSQHDENFQQRLANRNSLLRNKNNTKKPRNQIERSRIKN